MRKLTMVAAVVAALGAAGSALAGQGATNSAGEYIDLSVRITPPLSGTAKAPHGVGVAFDSFAGNRINAANELNTSSIKVVFHDNFKDNALLFPACQIGKTQSHCAKATQIGTGTAEAELAGSNGGPPTFVPATLAAYNGKPLKGKSPTIIFIASLGGKPAAELDFTIDKQGKGIAFNEIQFPSSAGVSIGISKFSVNIPDRTITHKVHGKKVEIHLITAPTSCHGAWTFSQTNTYSSGAAPLTATDSEPCVKG